MAALARRRSPLPGSHAAGTARRVSLVPMSGFTLRANLGMGLAALLLVVGGVLVVIGDKGTTLHHAGIAVLILSSAVYLVSRVTMMIRERN